MHCACFYHWKGQLDFFFFFAVVVMATIGISRVGGPLLTPLKVWIWAPCEHPFLNWKVLWAIGWSGEWCDSSSPLLLGLSAAQKHPSILRTVFISFFFFSNTVLSWQGIRQFVWCRNPFAVKTRWMNEPKRRHTHIQVQWWAARGFYLTGSCTWLPTCKCVGQLFCHAQQELRKASASVGAKASGWEKHSGRICFPATRIWDDSLPLYIHSNFEKKRGANRGKKNHAKFLLSVW